MFKVGGQGKPVRIRRGPATVTGDAHRGAPSGAKPPIRLLRTGKARGVSPGSQETSLRPKPTTPRGKGLAHVHQSSHRSDSTERPHVLHVRSRVGNDQLSCSGSRIGSGDGESRGPHGNEGLADPRDARGNTTRQGREPRKFMSRTQCY